jgi:prepilin signal peptidase PulO-like enzyme (type II secretory pathway)
MTGIQTVNSVWKEAYLLLVFTVIAGFAIYDMRKKRVPDKALVFFLPVALAAPFIGALTGNTGIAPCCLSSLLGAAAGFGVLLAAALASKNGNGVGGGDIKLAAVLGFIYGAYDIIALLLIASLLALPAGLVQRKRSRGTALRLPFVPFMAAGCFIITIIRLF